MTRIVCRWLIVLVAVAGGCSTISPDKKIAESLDLVEQATGQRPQWSAPWDDAPPAWDGTSVLVEQAAVAMALRNNRELRGDLEMIGQANADLVQAGLMQNPRFTFMAMFPDGGGRSMLRGGGFPMQPLQDLWLIPARKEVAQAQLQQAVLRVADRAVETVYRVKQLYARIQYAQRAMELIRANMEIVEQSRVQIQTQQTTGKATLVEVNVARIRYLRLQSEWLAMDAEYRSLKRQLLLEMGFATATDDWTVTPINELAETVEPPTSEQSLLAIAESCRLDLQAAEWTLAAADRRIGLTQREGWPEVALGVSFERPPGPRASGLKPGARVGNAVAQGLQGQIVEPSPRMPFAAPVREVDFTIGPMIDFELPIFDWNQAQVAKALHERQQRLAEYDGLRQAVAARVRETAVQYQQAYEQVQFFRDAILPEVERNLEVVRESYRAGREDVTVLLQVQEDVIMTRLSALEFVRDLLVNRAELERQVGGNLTPEAAPSPTSNPAWANDPEPLPMNEEDES